MEECFGSSLCVCPQCLQFPDQFWDQLAFFYDNDNGGWDGEFDLVHGFEAPELGPVARDGSWPNENGGQALALDGRFHPVQLEDPEPRPVAQAENGPDASSENEAAASSVSDEESVGPAAQLPGMEKTGASLSASLARAPGAPAPQTQKKTKETRKKKKQSEQEERVAEQDDGGKGFDLRRFLMQNAVGNTGDRLDGMEKLVVYGEASHNTDFNFIIKKNARPELRKGVDCQHISICSTAFIQAGDCETDVGARARLRVFFDRKKLDSHEFFRVKEWKCCGNRYPETLGHVPLCCMYLVLEGCCYLKQDGSVKGVVGSEGFLDDILKRIRNLLPVTNADTCQICEDLVSTYTLPRMTVASSRETKKSKRDLAMFLKTISLGDLKDFFVGQGYFVGFPKKTAWATRDWTLKALRATRDLALLDSSMPWTFLPVANLEGIRGYDYESPLSPANWKISWSEFCKKKGDVDGVPLSVMGEARLEVERISGERGLDFVVPSAWHGRGVGVPGVLGHEVMTWLDGGRFAHVRLFARPFNELVLLSAVSIRMCVGALAAKKNGGGPFDERLLKHVPSGGPEDCPHCVCVSNTRIRCCRQISETCCDGWQITKVAMTTQQKAKVGGKIDETHFEINTPSISSDEEGTRKNVSVQLKFSDERKTQATVAVSVEMTPLQWCDVSYNILFYGRPIVK